MYIQNEVTEEKVFVEIHRVADIELGRLKNSKRFGFDWSSYKKREVYKLCILGTKLPLGLMHVIDRFEAGCDFLEIDALEVSKENQGLGLGFGRIAGCLLAHAAFLSKEYGHDAFLALIAKTKKADLFEQKFGFTRIGSIGVLGERMVSDTLNSIELIKEYI